MTCASQPTFLWHYCHSPPDPNTMPHMHGTEIYLCCSCADKRIFLGMSQFFCNLPRRMDDISQYHQKIPLLNCRSIAFLKKRGYMKNNPKLSFSKIS